MTHDCALTFAFHRDADQLFHWWRGVHSVVTLLTATYAIVNTTPWGHWLCSLGQAYVPVILGWVHACAFTSVQIWTWLQSAVHITVAPNMSVACCIPPDWTLSFRQQMIKYFFLFHSTENVGATHQLQWNLSHSQPYLGVKKSTAHIRPWWPRVNAVSCTQPDFSPGLFASVYIASLINRNYNNGSVLEDTLVCNF